MTYEFFYKHASPFLSDKAIESLWKIDQLVGGIIARQPENDEFAFRTALAAQKLAERHPDRARTTQPTDESAAAAEIATLERMLAAAATEAVGERPSLSLDKPMIGLYFDAARAETKEAITVVLRNPETGRTTAFHLKGEAAPRFTEEIAAVIFRWKDSQGVAAGIHPAHADSLTA